jgi:hypothetical protein
MDSGESQYAPEANRRFFLTALVSSLTGNVSIGFMHATPGDMKSLRSSAERIALMVASDGGGGVARIRCATGAVSRVFGAKGQSNSSRNLKRQTRLLQLQDQKFRTLSLDM